MVWLKNHVLEKKHKFSDTSVKQILYDFSKLVSADCSEYRAVKKC